MTRAALPVIVDRMPLPMRKPRAGPLLDPDEVIACALNGVPYEFWKRMPLSATSQPVREVLNALRFAGYKIEPI
jgi:hypothetical protein